MKIYAKEKHIEDKILANKRSNVIAKITVDESDQSDRVIASIKNLSDKKFIETLKAGIKATETEGQHPYMSYGSAILVSTIVNKNDDAFLPAQTWAARKTPISTPYNQMHVENNIIGHIYDCRALNAAGEVIDDDTSVDNVPDRFDIEVDFVLYSFIFPKLTADIIQGAKAGTQFVSMECFIDDFDYLIIEGEDATLVDRNESTAFLSQYLRCYGGEGTYKGNRIVRALKDITFTGMGNVDNPANPDSVYTKVPKKATASQLTQIGLYNIDEGSSKFTVYTTMGKVMKIETIEQAVAEIEKLQTEIADKTKKIDEITAGSASQAESIKTLEDNSKSLTEQLATANKTIEDQTKKLKDIEDTAKANQRMSQLKELEFESENVEADITKLKTMSDEDFAYMISVAKKMKNGKKPVAPCAEDDKSKALDNAKASDKNDAANTANNPNANDTDDIQVIASKLADQLANRNKNKTSK